MGEGQVIKGGFGRVGCSWAKDGQVPGSRYLDGSGVGALEQAHA